MTFKQLRVAVYADGADKDAMIAEYKKGYVTGFTTNPSLMKKAGVTDYVSFAKEVVAAIPDLPLSFEVFGDDFETMEKEAKIISALGKNVFVKIPIMLTDGTSTAPLIKKLSDQGIQLNVTAIFTISQVRATHTHTHTHTQDQNQTKQKKLLSYVSHVRMVPDTLIG